MRSRCGCPCARWPASSGLPGVAAVYPVATYHADTDTVPALVGADPALGRRALDRRAGRQGRDHRRRHRRRARRSSRPRGMRAAAGLPARAAALHERPRDRRAQLRRRTTRRSADHLAFDPNVSEHGTHVAGIVAGAYGTVARPGLGLPVVRGPVRRGARRLARQLPRARARRSRERRDRLDGRARGRGRQAPSRTAWTCSTSRSAARRSTRRPMRCRWRSPMPRAPASPRSSPRATSFDSRGYGSISSPGTSATAITVAATSTTRVFGVSGTRQRRGLARAHAVHGGAVDRAARDDGAHAARRALVGTDGLRPRPSRLPRGAAAPAAARRRDRPARRLQLRLQGDQRARGGCAGA